MTLLVLSLLLAQVSGLDSEFHYDRFAARKVLLKRARRDPLIILPLLESDNFRVVQAACWVAARIKIPKALPTLLALSKSPNPQVALLAAEAMESYDLDSLVLFAQKTEAPAVVAVLLKKLKKELIDFIEKKCTAGTVFFYYPGQFSRFSRYGVWTQRAVEQILQEILQDKRRPTRSTATLLVYAVGDLKLTKLIPLLRKIRKKQALLGIDETILLTSLYLAGDKEPFEKEVSELEFALSGARGKTRALLYERLAGLYHQARLYSKAENFYRLLLSLDPNNPELRFNFACLLSVSGKTAEALTQLEKGMEQKTKSSDSEDWKKWLMLDGELEAVRRLPGFERLKKKFSLKKPE